MDFYEILKSIVTHTYIMIKRKVGWTNVEVSLIGQGTWMIEGTNHRNTYGIAIESLRLGLEVGMNHIDTAEMYGNGVVEELVGRAIAGRQQRRGRNIFG